MAKIRHIAYRCSDTATYEKFFVEGLEMEVVERRANGAVDLSDGTINITLLPASLTPLSGEAGLGVAHIGFTVEDDDKTRQRLEALGATEANAVRMDSAHYELKFEGRTASSSTLGNGPARRRSRTRRRRPRRANQGSARCEVSIRVAGMGTARATQTA